MSREYDIRGCRIEDAFWSARQDLIAGTVIPYQEKILNDAIPGIEKSHALANFRIAAGLEEGEFYGMVFQDSDVAKWLEGVAWSLAVCPDPELEARADAIIDVIAKAQQQDGYLDTYFILQHPERRFQNLQECHELYCAGHMMEAAAAYYEATGKDTLLNVMRRTVQCIDANIGPEEGKIHGIPGHEEIELGLLRIYETTGDETARQLAAWFINERGRNPDYFAEETARRGWIQWADEGGYTHNTNYNQSWAPVREQEEARGHSVRAMYLYSAMAEYAALSGDSELAAACERLWNDVTTRQMYLTGGLGQQARWEGFTRDYDLPNDTAYAETCASIGLVMFAHRMLGLKTDGRYTDVMERALYNGVLSGMQLDGKRFFYVNPLEVVPGISGKIPGYEHVLPQRPEWYPCACCPPNVVRLVMSLARYAWEERDHLILSHLYVGGEATFSCAKLQVESTWPWEGHIRYTFAACSGERFALAIHIPGYIEKMSVCLNGKLIPPEEQTVSCGYLYLTKQWKDGDAVDLRLDLPVRRTWCNPLVRANEGCVALERGPLVYCLEGADNGDDLQTLRVPASAAFRLLPLSEEEGPLSGITAIEFDGVRMRSASSEELYSGRRPVPETVKVRAIPYYAWGNRGENAMRVWIPEIG